MPSSGWRRRPGGGSASVSGREKPGSGRGRPDPVDNAPMSSSRTHRALTFALLLAVGAVPASLTASPRKTKTPAVRTPTTTPNTAVTARPAPRPATLVPDPPYVGTPAAGEKPYAGILRAKEAGASEEELLARVAKDGVRYSLSTPDMQTLRAAGLSPKVIEAMLRAGREPLPSPSVKAAAAAATPVGAARAAATPTPR